MLISINWIKDYVNLDGIDIKALINRFTLSTAEVEEIIEIGNNIKNVVVGKITQVTEHPNSQKLHILNVFDGNQNHTVVCGAPNVKENMIVPFAKNGGRVGELDIKPVKIAGVESFGMCCSEKELGISDDNSGLMELDENLILGTDIKTIFDIDDIIFEVDNKSLTNRPDLWGIYGIAREIAALVKQPLKPLDLFDVNDNAPEVGIKIQNDKCFRYSSVVIENINKKISPVNMRIRLTYCGMRPLNLLADLTNYVMLELGQPMHAFDYNIVSSINVRDFEEEIKFTTLDDIQRTIPKNTLMICSNDKPVCIAGVMGGLDSAINDNTNSVLLESANFDGVCVRKTATTISLRTESSARYEKILDPELTITAAKRFVMLLKNIDENIVIKTKITDIYNYKYPIINLEITKDYIDRYTGINIDNDTIVNTLRALGFITEYKNNTFYVTVPSFRATKDVTIKADLIEEITRIYGYDNFDITSNTTQLKPVIQETSHEEEYKIKEILAYEYSLNEIHSYIWNQTVKDKELGIIHKDNIKIVNSLGSVNNQLREYIIPSILGNIGINKNSNNNVNLFEIGRTVKGLDENNLCIEQKALGIVIASKELNQKDTFYKAKGIVEGIVKSIKNKKITYKNIDVNNHPNYVHPYNSNEMYIDNKYIGIISVLHPLVSENIDKKMNISFIEIDFNQLTNITKENIKYNEVSKYPGVELDLSFLINSDTTYKQIEDYLNEYGNENLVEYKFVDLYEDASLNNKKSLTLRFYFSSKTQTLSGEEINKYSEDIITHMSKKDMVLR